MWTCDDSELSLKTHYRHKNRLFEYDTDMSAGVENKIKIKKKDLRFVLGSQFLNFYLKSSKNREKYLQVHLDVFSS